MVVHMKDAAAKTAEMFKTIAEPNRLRILMMLRMHPMCVCEITFVLGLDQSTVSRHLAKLKAMGLVRDERRGQWVDFILTKPGRGSPEAKVLRLAASLLDGSEIVRKDSGIAKSADRTILCR